MAFKKGNYPEGSPEEEAEETPEEEAAEEKAMKAGMSPEEADKLARGGRKSAKEAHLAAQHKLINHLRNQ